MRNILVAGLFLSTVLVNAQTATKGQGATLVARNEAGASTVAPSPESSATDVSATPRPRRISTGVIGPKLISEPNLHVSKADFPTADLATQHAVVSFRVDENGAPQNVHLLKSAGQIVDERVMQAVRQYRFAPATLDDQVVAMDVNLVVNFTEQ